MRRLVVLNGSPDPGSSVSLLAASVCEGAHEAGAATDVFRCIELNVRPCIACGPDATKDYCIYHDDDMDRVYAALEAAHAIVVASPVYFDGVSAPLKAVIDRCNCITPLVTLPDGRLECVPRWARTRRGAFLTACSANHTHEHAEHTVRGFLKWVGAKWQETIVWRHADDERGSVGAGLLLGARDLGRRLVGEPPLEI